MRRVWLLLGLGSLVLIYFIKWYLNAKIVLPVLMVACIVLGGILFLRLRGKFNSGFMWTALLMLILSGLFRGLDLNKVGCVPMGWMQWHALWHVSTGLAAFFFLAFLRSEKP